MNSTSPKQRDDLDASNPAQTFPRLLPAITSITQTSPTDQYASVTRLLPTSSTLPPKAKRAHVVPAACEACRKRKSKCSAQRPKCHVCVSRGTDCVYTTATAETHTQALKRKYGELQTRQTPYEELFDILKTKPEQESLEIFRRIRAGGDIDSILRHVKDGDLLMQLLVAPQIHRQYQFPYIPEMPPFILSPDNQYIDSIIYDATSLGHTTPTGAALLLKSQAIQYQCPYLKPYRAAAIVDGTLSQVNVSSWTRVTSNNRLLRKLLQDYLLYEHPGTGFFNHDHFLEDMTTGRTRFCSQLLVNAVLAMACHISCEIPNRAHFWDPDSLGYRFVAEAKRLWETESVQQPNKLTTIQAAMLLSALSNNNGMDKIGTAYLKQAITMAQQEDLFEPAIGILDEKIRRSRALTAWGLFSWQASHCYSFLRAPYISRPPKVSSPDPFLDPSFYGEIRTIYPPSQTLSSIHLGCILKAHFDFCIILNNIASQIFAGDRFEATARQVLGFKDTLDAWFASLPEPLSPTKLALPDHITIHIEYYGTIIKLFQSILSPDRGSHMAPPAMETLFKTVITYCNIRLETLIRLHYLRHSFNEYSPRLMNWLIFLGNEAIEGIRNNNGDSTGQSAHRPSNQTLRSTLILCAKGLFNQGQNYHLAVPVYRALRDRMKPDDVAILSTFVASGEDGTEQPLMMQYIQSQWPVPLIKLNEDPKTGSLDRLVSKYGSMALGTVSSESD